MEVKNYFNPKDLDEAYDILTQDKKNQIIAGGAWLKLSLKKAETLVALDNLGLDKIEEKNGFIEIGSMVTLREIEKNDSVIKLYDGILAKSISKIMGMNIRNQATIGGSVMGKFAFSDILPVLLVMETVLVFHKNNEITLEEFLATPRMEKDILTKIKIRKISATGFFKKVAKTALDFSVVNVAVSKSEAKFKIAVGSRPQIANLAIKAMNFINKEKTVNEETFEKTAQIAVEEMVFSDNNRGSKKYREHLAKTYVLRGLRSVTQHES